MGVWGFVFLMNVILPLSMIGFGGYFRKRGGPEKINMAFGYRTSMSMKNEDTWRFAQMHCGRVWWIVGWILLLGSIGAMFCVLGRDQCTVGTVGAIVCGAQVILLIGSIIPVERALRKNFDQNGIRKTERG